MTDDASVNGGDADPDGDGNPNNNAGATTFTLESKQAPVNPIGVALAVVSSLKQPDNSYNVTYKITVKNFGEKALTNVSLSDSLVKAFPAPAAFTVVSGPTTRANSNLLANTGYDGSTNLDRPKAILGLRPEHLIIHHELEPGMTIPAQVELDEPMGADSLVWLECEGHQLSVRVPVENRPTAGTKVHLKVEIHKASVFDADSELRI